MKFILKVCVLSFLILGTSATLWQNLDVKSPLESPRYSELMKKLYPEGLRGNLTRTGRIINGSPARLGQFPYQVYTLLYNTLGAGYICGGSVSFFYNKSVQNLQFFSIT
jgi:secreted trypsin-like serine protease